MIFFLLSISFRIHKLEKHETKDVSDSHINGSLTVVWRDWDKIIKHPQMVYVNFIDPKQVKGPHLHQNRTSYFYCISGEVVLIIKDENGKFHEVISKSDEPQLVEIPNGIGAAILNRTKTPSTVLVLADISWKPDDNEMKNVTFEDYNWDKWK